MNKLTAPTMQTPTLGASYTSSPKLGHGTKLGRSLSDELERPDAWLQLQAVVLPMCCGKSTYALRFGGYDIDDIVVNERELACDTEALEMFELRHQAVWEGKKHQLIPHNQILLNRARRFFTKCSPDSNLMIVYLHTVELADALGIPVLACVELDKHTIASSSRMSASSPDVRATTLKIAEDQAAANRVYMQRAGLGVPRRCTSFTELDAYLTSVLSRQCNGTPETRAMMSDLLHCKDERARLDNLHAFLKRKGLPKWAYAVAARNLQHALGDLAPEESHHHHNHPGWARYVHAVASCIKGRPSANPQVPRWDEDTVRERFPLGPGSAAFAMFNIADWLNHTPQEAWEKGWLWAKQLMSSPNGASYERLAATIVMGDVLSYAKPEYAELCYRMPLGYLNTEQFTMVTQHAHALVRAGCNYLGEKLPVKDLALFTYWHCLVGRHLGKLDMEKEITDRTHMRTPKYWFYADGRRSSTEFTVRLRQAIEKSYHHMAVVSRDKLLSYEETIRDLGSFLKNRKAWVKPGSATGAPKADIYLSTKQANEQLADELGAELLDATHLVIRKMRLNKAATFEFPEFPRLVEEALAKFEPSSFTRYFCKHEVGKLEGRALYPANLLHYVVTSYVLYLAEKGGTIPHTRINAAADQQLQDHWLWSETREYVFGLMLDYANFNEQHEIEHMKLVIEELAYYYQRHDLLSAGMLEAIRWVSASFDNITCEHDGKVYKFNHGLLSGWRCTSWINSILNVAYLEVIAQQVHSLTGIKVLTDKQTGGDDVAATTASLYDAVVILRVGEAMGFEFKAIKQLMGSGYVEFFRLFVGPDGVRGSLCRMLGSAVSGQWSNSVIAKFIDPASKLSSIVEIARKAGRRCELNLNLMEKMSLCAFEKWAKHDDIVIARELIHGTIATGGLGVPTVTGDVFELEPFEADEHEDQLEMVGLPDDASMQAAQKVVAAVEETLGPNTAIAPKVLAQRMARAVFEGAAATARGPRLAQRLRKRRNYGARPRIKAIKSVRPEEVELRHHTRLRKAMEANKDVIKAYRKAKDRYDFLSSGVKEQYKTELATRVAIDHPGVDPGKLYNWCELNTLYGCATYMLTEDYYEAVVILSIIESEAGSEDEVSRIAAAYATGLAAGGFTMY
uniref:RNA-directed RNA polymerase n=1 Tax=Alphachrysovirus aspergilli TaxID=607716 RepID=A0A679AY81_9VIRU|nr:putative RNA-dependent RNA polymerase [Alphachrysovirus aspergilli]